MRGTENKWDDKHPGAEAKVLPAREALSLISTDPLSGYWVDDPSGSDSSSGATPAQETADRPPDTDVAGVGRGEESITSKNRSEHFNRTDSASSET